MKWKYKLVNSTATQLSVTTVVNTAKFTMSEFNDNGETGGIKLTAADKNALSVSTSVGENEFINIITTFNSETGSEV